MGVIVTRLCYRASIAMEDSSSCDASIRGADYSFAWRRRAKDSLRRKRSLFSIFHLIISLCTS